MTKTTRRKMGMHSGRVASVVEPYHQWSSLEKSFVFLTACNHDAGVDHLVKKRPKVGVAKMEGNHLLMVEMTVMRGGN
jgi:hypothetical protein